MRPAIVRSNLRTGFAPWIFDIRLSFLKIFASGDAITRTAIECKQYQINEGFRVFIYTDGQVKRAPRNRWVQLCPHRFQMINTNCSSRVTLNPLSSNPTCKDTEGGLIWHEETSSKSDKLNHGGLGGLIDRNPSSCAAQCRSIKPPARNQFINNINNGRTVKICDTAQANDKGYDSYTKRYTCSRPAIASANQCRCRCSPIKPPALEHKTPENAFEPRTA